MHDSLQRFAKGVSHDANNTIASVQGFAEIAASLLEDQPPMLQRSIHNIVRGCAQAYALVEDIRLMTGEVDLPLERVAISPLVEMWVQKLREQSSQCTVQLVCSAEQVIAHVAPDFLERAFEAVWDNAVWATGGQGCIDVSVRSAGDVITLIIRDSGMGILPDIAACACEPYFTTRSDEGRKGKGLAVARGILRAHGGNLFFLQAPEKGCRVALQLPLSF